MKIVKRDNYNINKPIIICRDINEEYGKHLVKLLNNNKKQGDLKSYFMLVTDEHKYNLLFYFLQISRHYIKIVI